MTSPFDVEGLLRDLEALLLDPAVRSTSHEVAALLDDTFVEFGQSGRIYDKASMVAALHAEGEDGSPAATREMVDFEAKVVGPGVVLTTYRVIARVGDETRESLRSSLWRQRDGTWRIVFHQGTPRPLAG